MPKEFSRTRRVGEQLRRELADLIRHEIKDPRVGMVTLNAVEVARDLGHAQIYVTLLEDDAQRRSEAVAVLNRAAGFLRRELGRRLSMRVIPHLHFQYDESVERGMRLSNLIAEAVAADRAKDEPEDS